MFSIGQNSTRTGVKVPPIRYYEQMGLITAEKRTEVNQRWFSQEGLDRIARLKRLEAEVVRIKDSCDGKDECSVRSTFGDHRHGAGGH